MRVLVVLGGFFPAQTYGGPTVSIDNLCSLLCDDVKFYIVTSNHELNSTESLFGIEDGWNERDNCKVRYLKASESNYKGYKSAIEEVNPDIIYINSLFSANKTIPFMMIAKKKKIPVLLAPRGELCINAFDKKYKKIPYLFFFRELFSGENVFYQSTSDEETEQIGKVLHIRRNNIYELTNVATISHGLSNRSKKKKGQCKLVFISRIQAKKNLLFALEILQDVKSEVCFDIYGSLEEDDYWGKCKKIINVLPQNVHAKYIGQLDHQEVADTFSRYHGFLFPTLSENYGHVIVESMMSGCPVIMSDQVPWTDVNSDNAGWSIPLSDKKGFVNAVETLCGLDEIGFSIMSDRVSQYIRKKTKIEELKHKYLDAFNVIGRIE